MNIFDLELYKLFKTEKFTLKILLYKDEEPF